MSATRRCFKPARMLAWMSLGLAVPAALAQTDATPPPEDTLVRLIKEYEAQRTSIERPMLAAYAQRLALLHEALEKRRDPGAATVATELAAVQAQLSRAATSEAAAPGAGPTEKPAAEKLPTGPLELLGAKARTTGGATTGDDQNSPVQFAGKDSAAEWTLPKLPTGRYRLLWRIACEVGAGATVRLTIDGQPPRTLEVLPTTASGDALVANLGEFTATAAPGWVRVEVLSLPGRPRKIGPSFSLSKLILIPPGVTMPGL